jgi:hypothetical protein
MRLRPGASVARRIRALDPASDADEIARLSLVVLHGSPALTYALFTVAFMKQVAVPTMARTLYRRGRGDIVEFPLRRNDDTIVFFGQLLDHGPDSAIGRAWIERLNAIHARFPLRNADSLYTLATLALDPHAITADLGRSPFTAYELEAQWRFWRAVARHQHIDDIPETREELARWAADYEYREYAPTPDGRAVSDALIEAFARRVLPAPLRGSARSIVAVACPPELRRVHGLPEPTPVVRRVVRAALQAHVAATPLRPIDVDRSLVTTFGTARYGERPPDAVGYQGRRRPDADRP